MRKLSGQEIERIVRLLKEGKPLPEDDEGILYDTKKEYELSYSDKERDKDILIKREQTLVHLSPDIVEGKWSNKRLHLPRALFLAEPS